MMHCAVERGLSSPHGRGLPPQIARTDCDLLRSSGAIPCAERLPPRLPPRLHARLERKAAGGASGEAAPTKLQLRSLDGSRAALLASRKPSAAAAAPSGRHSSTLRLRSKGQFSQGGARGGAPRPDRLGALLAVLLSAGVLCTRCGC